MFIFPHFFHFYSTFEGGEQSAYETDGASVVVVGSAGSHDHGSSKIKLKNIVDYKWEVKNYIGRLIAVHLDGKYVAYAIKGNYGGKSNKTILKMLYHHLFVILKRAPCCFSSFHAVAGKKGNIEGMVRVANPVTGQRALIRGKSSEVLDLQFAHMKSQIMLASIENTALHIHKIETINDNIICTLLLKIDDPIEGHVPKFDKINWCPYVPENETESDSDAGKLLVWTRGSSFQCYNVGTVVDSYGVSSLFLLVVQKRNFHASFTKQSVNNVYKKIKIRTAQLNLNIFLYFRSEHIMPTKYPMAR